MKQRNLFLVLLLAALGFACTTTENSMSTEGPPTQPAPAPEMAQLQRMIGTWEGTATMITPAPEGEAPHEYASGGTTSWTLNGMYIKSSSWHEMPGGLREHYEEFITWDEDAGKFHAWYHSDWGNRGESYWTVSDDKNTFHVKATGMNGNTRTRGTGMITFVNDTTMEWTWTEKSSKGTMSVGGTSYKL